MPAAACRLPAGLTDMTMKIGCTPCCWGVDDVNNPHLPPWRHVLAEAAQAGYSGIELGSYGYIPLARGVMCPIGTGALDYPSIRRARDDIGYAGYITIEQARDPRNAGTSLRDVAASRAFLASAGFA
ncbi:xylose isomerase [Burkholderia anthina]|uniref:Xylose isomerase n=2 Tax=Burkholderia anthina TaxID=179879 RepID=A0A6P2G4L4_9BURK|nr:xylose isomerase [Burkholderia anthina]